MVSISPNESNPTLSPGEYRVGLKFNEQHIPDSPFKVYISPQVGDAYLLEVAQFPDSAQVDKPTQFYIRLNGAKGSLAGMVSLLEIYFLFGIGRAVRIVT